MPNLRIIHDNAADRATTAVASTTAGTLVMAYTQNNYKGQAHRSTGTSVTYTHTWTNGESIGGTGLPATNLTASATVRQRLYSDVAGTALIADSGIIFACPGLNLGLWDWSLPLNSNAFAFGGLSKSAVWFDAHWFAKKSVIDIVDTTNPAGYIDCARIVMGPYFEPSRNADWGVQSGVVDTTKTSRNDAGDLLADRGTLHDSMSLNLKMIPEADRAQLMRIFRSSGVGRNMFLSLLPNNANSVLEQDHMIYGKRANSPVSFDFFGAFSNKCDMEGW